MQRSVVLVAKIFDFLHYSGRNLSLGLSLTQGHIVDKLDEILGAEELPEAIRTHNEELIKLEIQVNVADLGLRADADLMRDQIADGPGYFEAGVHSRPQEDPLQAVTGLSDFSTVVVDPDPFTLDTWLVGRVVQEQILAASLAFVFQTPQRHVAVSDPAQVQLLWRLDNESGAGSAQKNVEALLSLTSSADPLLEVLMSNPAYRVVIH